MNFTKETMNHLRACRAQGMSKRQASDELGICHVTLTRHAAKAGFKDELSKLFPHGGKPYSTASQEDVGIGKAQKLTVAEVEGKLSVDTSLLHVRAAIMDWRKAA